MEGTIGVIGLGVIGAPIAHKLYKWNKNRFVLIASGNRKEKLINNRITINNEEFAPQIISDKTTLSNELSLIIVCVKNFQLESAIKDIKRVISRNTILLPLENGIVAYRKLREAFPENVILEGYVQGPNTIKKDLIFQYSNPGKLHMGSSQTKYCDDAIDIYLLLKDAAIPIIYEAEIKKMVWKKWMLNVAGNTVTALLDASYADFKNSIELQNICRKIMDEFITVAIAEHIYLEEQDVENIISYFINYKGDKITSMLDDVRNKNRTENDYITGEIIRVAKKHGIVTPVNDTMYMLVKAKESLYLK